MFWSAYQREKLLDEVFEGLNPGGTAWFVLPNYPFPYEQHFEGPIVLSKQITEKLFGHHIRNHQASLDPAGIWADLSWPTQKGVRKFLDFQACPHEISRGVLEGYFGRLHESRFIERKGFLNRALRPLLKALKPEVIALPLDTAPIVGFTINKPTGRESKLSDCKP